MKRKLASLLFFLSTLEILISSETNIKKYDFGFSGALHDSNLYAKGAYQTVDLRRRVQELVASRKDLNWFLNGSDSIQPRISSIKEYARILNSTKIWLSTPCSFMDMPPRYYEVAMSNTLIFTNPVHELYQDTFRDGENCIYFKEDLSDFLDKLYYYLENVEERRRITLAAYDEFCCEHTWGSRVNELFKIIRSFR